jgi:Zn-finger nucleic acid-binding protein
MRSNRNQPEIIPPPVRMAEVERQIYCPSCRRKMDTHPYGGPGNVVIDNCPRCKVNWLDHDELHRITRAPERRGSDWGEPEDYEWLFEPRKKPDENR